MVIREKPQPTRFAIALIVLTALVFGFGVAGVQPASADATQVEAKADSPEIATYRTAAQELPSSIIGTESAPTQSELSEQVDPGLKVEPQGKWGAVIRILTTKSACMAAKKALEKAFPNYSKLKCVKSGKVWLLLPR